MKSKLTEQEKKELREQYEKMPRGELNLLGRSLREQWCNSKTFHKEYGDDNAWIEMAKVLSCMFLLAMPINYAMRTIGKQMYMKENVTCVENGGEKAKADMPSKYSDGWFLFDKIIFAASLTTFLACKTRDWSYRLSKTYAMDKRTHEKAEIAFEVSLKRIAESIKRERA